MAWYSILPPQLIQIESWAVRIFFLLGLITIVPWCAMIIFDAGLYLYRMVLWEIPWIGGRARGHQRPRAPSLTERSESRRRAFGLKGVESPDDISQGTDNGQSSKDHSEENYDAAKENIALVSEAHQDPTVDGDVKRRTSGRA